MPNAKLLLLLVVPEQAALVELEDKAGPPVEVLEPLALPLEAEPDRQALPVPLAQADARAAVVASADRSTMWTTR